MSQLYDRKDYYTKYLASKGVDLGKHLDISDLETDIDLNEDLFYKFAEDNRDKCLQKYVKPRPFFTADSMAQYVYLQDLGYNEHNSYEYNYGITQEHNSQLIELLGDKVFTKLNIDKQTASVRLLEYKPGNGIPLHIDSYNAFRDRNNLAEGEGSIHRYFIAVSPWSWGHFLQVHDNVIHHWRPGYVCEIPNNVFHLSVNYGIEPKLSLTLTGHRSC